MTDNGKIRSYDTRAFTEKYIPADDLRGFFRGDFNKFLIMPVEEMYRHVHEDVPPSRSTTHILVYLTAGEGYMKIGHEQYTIEPGEMMIVPAGLVFSFEAYSESKFNKGFICTFHESMFTGKYYKPGVLNDFDFLKVWGDHVVRFSKPAAKDITWLCGKLATEYAQNELGNSEVIRSYFLALLNEINAAYRPGAPVQNTSVKLVNAFRELLLKHIRSVHRVGDYAGMLNVTPNHLNKVVKNITGRSASNLIDETLLLEAKVLLYQTERSVGDVAAEVGITDQSYFSRLFKKYEGVTPLQFRKMIEKS